MADSTPSPTAAAGETNTISTAATTIATTNDNNTNHNNTVLSGQCVGVIVCKLSVSSSYPCLSRGYIAMLSVRTGYRQCGLASQLVSRALSRMKADGADLCSLETELSNLAAQALYDKFNFVRSEFPARPSGFSRTSICHPPTTVCPFSYFYSNWLGSDLYCLSVRDVRLPRYYLNGSDAFRLKLWFTTPTERREKYNRMKREHAKRALKQRETHLHTQTHANQPEFNDRKNSDPDEDKKLVGSVQKPGKAKDRENENPSVGDESKQKNGPSLQSQVK